MKLTVERLGTEEKLEITIPEDSILAQWEETLRIVLRWVSFTEETINELFGKEKS